MSLKLVLKKGALFGYSTKFNKSDRRKILVGILNNNKASYRQVINRLNILRIYNKYKDNLIWKKVSDDMLYLKKIFRPHLKLSKKHSIKRSKKPQVIKKRSSVKRSKKPQVIKKRSVKRSKNPKLLKSDYDIRSGINIV